MKVLTWNLQWASPRSKRGEIIRARLEAAQADVICLTEAFASSLPANGVIIEAAQGNEVADRKGAKKVLLWSRAGWEDVSLEPSFSPAGRVVSGITNTSHGRTRVVGLCIPWAGSGTPRYGGDRQPWADHLTFLTSLKARVASCDPAILIGDFNQRLPRQRQPNKVAEALEEALADLVVATRGFESADGARTIDHIAHTVDLNVRNLAELARYEGRLELSDHFGVMADIVPA